MVGMMNSNDEYPSGWKDNQNLYCKQNLTNPEPGTWNLAFGIV